MRIIEYAKRKLKHTITQLQYLWLQYLWTRPDNLWAFKVATSIALMVIPSTLVGEPFVGCTLALGSVGAALAESNDHPRGRLRSLIVTIVSFLIVSLSVELLNDYPILFALGLALTTFSLVILGGLGSRYQGITFGALLVSIYAMLGVGIKEWYYQPILLPLGGLMYGSISLLFLSLRPYRLVKEQLAMAFFKLADYMELKASLFPCDREQHKRIRTTLAEKNVAIGSGIDATKAVIYACLGMLEGHDLSELTPLYNRWLLLQQLHERAASSHQRYDVLSKRCNNPLLIKGMGQLLYELSKAIRLYAKTILMGNKFKLPEGLQWTREMVGEQLKQSTHDPEYAALNMLYNNLSRLSYLLAAADEDVNTRIPVEQLQYRSASFKVRLRVLLSPKHTLFRHAVRLTLCLVIGYALMVAFAIPKGTWIPLTALFVCQRSYVATRQRLTQRIIGTVSGVVLGVIFAQLLPTQAGQIVLLLVSIFTFFYWVRKRYAYAVVFVTIFVIAAFNLQTGTGVEVMGYRLLCTFIGALLAYLSVRYLWPDWQYRHLPQLMAEAMTKNLRYFHTIYSNDARGPVYYHNRRTAHQADNAIAIARQGMAVEPRDKRFMLRKAFALTYRNHALLSYISALGAHHYNRPLTSEEIIICQRIEHIIDQVRCNFDNLQMPSHCALLNSKEAKEWCTELKAKQDFGNYNIVILYNIARVASELLAESENKKVG